MLIRTVGEGGVLVLGGERPGIVAVLKSRGSKTKLGLSIHVEVPIFNTKVLRGMIRRELEHAERESSDSGISLTQEEILALRAMMILLEDPVGNSATITELLSDPALVDLTFGAGAAPVEE